MRFQGKIGRVIRVRSTLQEDVDLLLWKASVYLTKAPSRTTGKFTIESQNTSDFDTAPSPSWTTLCSDQPTFLHYNVTKNIPHPLTDLLWRAITDVPRAPLVLHDLTT